jgi:hypothetical protein
VKISPTQLALLCVAAFGAIVAANIAVTYKSNDDFKAKLQNLAPGELMALRTRVIGEENMEAVEEVVEIDEIE